MKRQTRMNGSRLLRLLTLVSLAAMAFTWWSASADDDEKRLYPYLPFYSFADHPLQKGHHVSILFGGVAADASGTGDISGLSAGRAAEYRSVESSPLLGIRYTFDGGADWSWMKFIYLGKDDFLTESAGTMGDRLLINKSRLNKYPHRLDNDLAADWAASSYFDVDAQSSGLHPGIDVTEALRTNRIRPAFLPGFTFYADLRTLWRSGHRQARTMDHCTACHVTAVGQELTQRIWDIDLGAEVARGPVVLRYINNFRYSEGGGQALTHDYRNVYGNFDLEGVQPFAAIPSSSTLTHSGAGRIDLASGATALFKVRKSRTANKSTGYELDATRLSGVLTVKPSLWLTLKGRYDRLEKDNEVPLASDRQVDRFSGTAAFKPARELRLEGSYRWERIDRSGGTELERTSSAAYRFKATYRPDRTLRLMAAYRKAEVEDPFGRVLRNSFSRIDDTFLSPMGTDETSFEASLFYAPKPASGINVSYNYGKSENGTLDLEATTQRFTVGGYALAADWATVHGRVFFYDNDVQRDVYLGVLAPLLEITRIPYNGRGMSAEFGLALRAGKVLTFRPHYVRTTAESSFDDVNFGSGAAAPSAIEVTINRLGLEANFHLSETWDLLFYYSLDDYGDTARPTDDGRVHWALAGLACKF